MNMLLRAVAVVAAGAIALAADIPQPVRVTGGLVAGATAREAGITAFKGIPYAAPPVGPRRWQAPGPVVPWKGVRKAGAFGPSCIQTIVTEKKPWTYEFMAHGEVSEDCLFVNVWTPARSAGDKRPVFVYIYGGAFTEGSGAVPAYDGEGLARKGLVVVTFNYRVGVLGFLTHPELTKESGVGASGNYALLDQVAALRWVRDNIAAFGGDPGCVTIAGQSAGAASVHALIASPLARGLFHRAIAQSGGSSVGPGGVSMRFRTLADSEGDGLKFAQAKGAASIADLRAMDWQTIIAPLPPPAAGGASPQFRFSPVVDGYLLPLQIDDIVAQGRQNDVPILTGVNAGELGGIFMTRPEPVTAEAFTTRARRQYGAQADEFLELYPAASDQQAAAAQAASARDGSLTSLYLWARLRARTAKTSAYLYLWDHALPGPDAALYGAFHSSEIPYVLNTLYMSDRPFTEADRRIADLMSSCWARFAATGDPNGGGLPRWEPAGDKPEVMELGDTARPVAVAGSAAKFAFYQKRILQRPSTAPPPAPQAAGNYRVDPLRAGLWRIQAITGTPSTAYLVEGTTQALVIDTCSGQAGLKAVVTRLIGDKPVSVALTHGHGDHSGGIGEFEKVFVHPADRPLLRAGQGARPSDFADGATFDLGGKTIEAIAIPGHTPGSIAVLDRRGRYILTGDGIGSTMVWMQISSLPLTAYLQSVKKLEAMKEGIDELLVGHHEQESVKLTPQYITDMRIVTERVLAGTIDSTPYEMGTRSGRQATYGSARLVYNPDRLR